MSVRLAPFGVFSVLRTDQRTLCEFPRLNLARFKTPHGVTFLNELPKLRPVRFKNTFCEHTVLRSLCSGLICFSCFALNSAPLTEDQGRLDAEKKFVHDLVAAWNNVMNLDRFDVA